MTFTAGETGLIFYCVNHLKFSLNNMVPGAQVYELAIFNAHLRVPVLYSLA